MMYTPIRSKVPGIFLILLGGMALDFAIEGGFHIRGEWFSRILCGITMGVVYAYVHDKFPVRKS